MTVDDDDATPLIEPAPLLWRLPIVRHVRAVVFAFRVSAWEQQWRSLGYVPRNFDGRVVRQIWRGIV